MSEDEFWGSSMKQLSALMDRRRDAVQRSEFGPALSAALMWNAWMAKDKSDARTPEDFMPSMAKEQRPQTPEEMALMRMSAWKPKRKRSG